MFKWYMQCRDKTSNITGPEIRENPKHLTEILGHENFKASNDWITILKR